MPVNQEWLAQVTEDIVDPDRPIVDPHHHFWKSGRWGRYLLGDLWADTNSGHRIERTVFLECRAEYDQSVPEIEAPVGETRFVADLAAQSTEGEDAQVCGIIGHVNFRFGNEVEAVLNAHIEAGNGLFRGIRQSCTWDASDLIPNAGNNPVQHLYLQDDFHEGFAHLAPLGLSFESWLYHTQLPDLTDLARTFPDTTIVVNHLGGPLGIGPYANRREEVFAEWSENYATLSECSNVFAKIGGIAMTTNGFGWDERDLPPTSDELADAQRPYYLHAIECFGPNRCMFESNFPVEKQSVSYHVLWNTFKKVAVDFSEEEKDDLFRGTATKVYRL